MYIKRNKSIETLIKEMKEGKYLPSELIQNHLDRIEKVNPSINAVVTKNKNALKEAYVQDDKYINKTYLGALSGIPVTIKDNISVACIRATAGDKSMARNIPKEDAILVQRLKEQGAVILGKTNLPKLAMDAQTYNDIYGRTNNPYNLDYTVGGSSGGSAAAVTSAMSVFDIGNDLLGSIRIPASYCGVFSITPTENIVPHEGMLPETKTASLLSRFIKPGIMAGNPDDLKIVLNCIAGKTTKEPSITPAYNGESKKPLCGITVFNDFDIPVDNEIIDTINSITIGAQKAGIKVKTLSAKELRIPELHKVFNRIFMTHIGMQIPSYIRSLLRYFKKIKEFDMSLKSYIKAENLRQEISSEYEHLLKEENVFILPVSATTAFKHRKPDCYKGGMPIYKDFIKVNGTSISYKDATTYLTIPFSVTGNPVVTIPLGLSSKGLPVCVQVVGGKWSDNQLISFAKRLYEINCQR
jgi:amidase